jgi:hypothetical protein
MWYRVVCGLAAVLFALSGISVKAAGTLAVAGGIGFVSFLALLVWVVATSVVVWRIAAPAADAAAKDADTCTCVISSLDPLSP